MSATKTPSHFSAQSLTCITMMDAMHAEKVAGPANIIPIATSLAPTPAWHSKMLASILAFDEPSGTTADNDEHRATRKGRTKVAVGVSISRNGPFLSAMLFELTCGSPGRDSGFGFARSWHGVWWTAVQYRGAPLALQVIEVLWVHDSFSGVHV